MKTATYVITVLSALIAGLVLLVGCGSPDDPDPGPPQIVSFTAEPQDIIPGDSSLLSWQVLRADSVTIDPGNLRLGPEDSVWVYPAAPTLYTVNACNADGCDNESAAVTMSALLPPNAVVFPEGEYYTMLDGVDNFAPPIVVGATDSVGLLAAGLWIHFLQIEGDGTVSRDSLLTPEGLTSIDYQFTGALGHAILEASSSGLRPDTAILRSSKIIPGASWQGQYILGTDHYWDVLQLNGEPLSVDPDPGFWVVYANYEEALGVVVVVEDISHDSLANNYENVVGVILNTVYAGTTSDLIGIGSGIADIRTAYGTPDTLFLDPVPPPAIVARYDALGMTFYCDPADTTVFEIHLFDAGKSAQPAPRRVDHSPADWEYSYRSRR